MWSIYFQIFIAFVVGIYLGEKVKAENAIIIFAGLIFAALLNKFILKKFSKTKVLVLAFVAAGIVICNYCASEMSRTAYPLCDKYIDAIGKISDLPEYDEEQINRYIVSVKRMSYLDKEYKTDEKIIVYSKEAFKFGDSIKFSGFLETFKPPLNEGDFDWGRHNKSKGIYFKLTSEDAKIYSQNLKENNILYFVTWIKSKISEKINEVYEKDDAATLHAMLMGYKNFFSEEREEFLYESNTMRMFYPVYLHLLFMLTLCGALKPYIGKKRSNIILIAILALYMLFNINTPYIFKTSLVLILSIVIKEKMGYVSYVELVAVVAFFMLVKNPLLLYNTGFVLSIISNMMIANLLPVIEARLKIKNYKIRRFVALWIILGIGMAGVQAYYFYSVNPYSFLLNLIYFPLMSAVGVAMPLKTGFKMGITNYTLNGLLFYIEKLPMIFAKLPFYSILVKRPRKSTILIAFLVMFLVWLRAKKAHKFAKRAALCILSALLFVNLIFYISDIGKLRIDFVNVSQGDGAVLSNSLGETVIIDGGGTEFSDYDYGKEIFLPFLKRNGHTRIELAIVSHYHTDHCLGVIRAMEKLNVDKVLIPDCMEENPCRKRIEALASEKKIEILYAEKGDSYSFKSGLVIDILSAENKKKEDENDTSLVLRVRYGDFSALFTGDITSAVEKRYKGKWGRASVLKVAHHGSSTSSAKSFIQEVSPRVAIISLGEDNSHNFPDENVLKRLKDQGCAIYRTDLNGNITIKARTDGRFKVKKFR